MKVELEKDYRDFYTVREYEQAKNLIKFFKEEDDESVEHVVDRVKYLFSNVRNKKFHEFGRIVEAKAETRRNNDLQPDYHGEDMGYIDVWITAIGQGCDENYNRIYVELGFFLSDFWGLCSGGDDDNSQEIADKIVQRVFREVD